MMNHPQSYDDLTLILDDEGYVNATNLCDNAGVHFNDWVKAKGKQFIAALQKYEKKTMLTVEHANGIYVHPELVPHLANWISPSHGIKATRIVQKKFSSYRKLKDKVNRRDDTIAELEQQRRELEDKCATLSSEIEKLQHQQVQDQDQPQPVQYHPVLEQRCFGLYQLNKFSHVYTFYCCQEGNVKAAQKNIKNTYPGAEEILKLDTTSSKEGIKKCLRVYEIITHDPSNRITLPPGMCEDRLLRLLRKRY